MQIQETINDYSEHIRILQARIVEALERESLDGLVIHSGQGKRHFLDDTNYPFRVNPHFKAFLPVVDNPNSWIIVNGKDKPKLIFYQPDDFWHKVPETPNSFWVDHFDIQILKQANKVEQLLPYDKAKYAYVGEYIEVAKALGFELVNPDRVMHFLHYHRSYKTDYELSCMREANKVAVKAHKAASEAFYQHRSEFEINQAYLLAANQGASEVPYDNIVALNEHASILHYTLLDNVRPTNCRSFLIDAGASFNGYASDVTRTYSIEKNEYYELIQKVNNLTLFLIESIKPGKSYVEVHQHAYLGVAQILVDMDIINMTAEQAVQTGIVSTFFPHGIGHPLGLQVHDVAGHVVDDRGTPKPPPEQHPFLRCTRIIEPRHVYTIEPGIYFIASLLEKLKGSEHSKYVNWNVVDMFRPYGGVRIEDNVIVHRERNENMTREAGLE